MSCLILLPAREAAEGHASCELKERTAVLFLSSGKAVRQHIGIFASGFNLTVDFPQ